MERVPRGISHLGTPRAGAVHAPASAELRDHPIKKRFLPKPPLLGAAGRSMKGLCGKAEVGREKRDTEGGNRLLLQICQVHTCGISENWRKLSFNKLSNL
ncbi:uncharacterized protein LOC144246307 isoform X3 [Lonchura striata]